MVSGGRCGGGHGELSSGVFGGGEQPVVVADEDGGAGGNGASVSMARGIAAIDFLQGVVQQARYASTRPREEAVRVVAVYRGRSRAQARISHGGGGAS